MQLENPTYYFCRERNHDFSWVLENVPITLHKEGQPLGRIVENLLNAIGSSKSELETNFPTIAEPTEQHQRTANQLRAFLKEKISIVDRIAAEEADKIAKEEAEREEAERLAKEEEER